MAGNAKNMAKVTKAHRKPTAHRRREWRRYVAIGDSTTEGLDDRDETGQYRGWADRLATHIATHQGSLEYANLALRGRCTTQIRDEQLAAALDLRPDLVTVVAGMNDILKPTFDAAATAAEVERMFAAFAAIGATVLTFTLPDPTPNLPFTAVFQPRLREFNDQLRRSAARINGAIMVDVASFPSASDPRLWCDDRLHGNSAGHQIVAHALAHGLGLRGFDDSWRRPLPPDDGRPALSQAVIAELSWAQQHALPWLWRSVRGRSAGDGLGPKHTEPIRLASR